jgi:hypothetical protein
VVGFFGFLSLLLHDCKVDLQVLCSEFDLAKYATMIRGLVWGYQQRVYSSCRYVVHFILVHVKLLRDSPFSSQLSGSIKRLFTVFSPKRKRRVFPDWSNAI